MKALVISDTHIKWQEDIDKLESTIEPFLDEVDLIIHAGDSVSYYVIDYLRKQKQLFAVVGNMDDAELHRILAKKLTFEFGGFKVGLMHGYGAPHGLADRVFEEFIDDHVDAVIYGHSHEPKIEFIKGILVLNPGSLTSNRYSSDNTLAIIKANAKLEAEIISV